MAVSGFRTATVLIVSVTVVACAPARFPAPVESRNVGKAVVKPRVGSAVTPAVEVQAPVPDGFYRIRRGDTLIGISLDHGVAWRDLASWNNIENPNLIEVDQLLRVRPPSAQRQTASPEVAPEPTVAATEVRPIGPASPPPAVASEPAAPAKAQAIPAADPMQLSWPSKGKIITQFADPGYKGIAISGAEGDPILAAGDGRVVYSGNGLRGYGNLVILKHEGDFLTAYAHNKSILVSEGQAVKRGQKIAELGKTDADVPKLHFEVRRSGKPVDPLKFLAQR